MQYLFSVIDDELTYAEVPSPETDNASSAVDAFNERLQAEGHWVYANGLAAPGEATVIDNRGEEPVYSDGPYLESKEFLGGFWIIEADNLDVALKLAADGSKACNRKVEVRPMADAPA